ncbi:NAD(P)H-dependent oxidoreductase [Gracilibacillus salinarum]|uniref:NAD(P)H-dependent oxidoreductase n=1 Tax=Gracilibacillus salinarum TaxID=2932255 RepID=A0ABY4GH58_9BACI|nr:NAD(P)H-dependent oxidoreductase [Gracilibacillus salinarum]UOQ83668.1 NAD(P)H-dependent oxidoreductase [Gracilibacillus salinarum]
MKVLTIVTHPREDSLTFQIAYQFVKGLRDAGHQTEIIDSRDMQTIGWRRLMNWG